MRGRYGFILYGPAQRRKHRLCRANPFVERGGYDNLSDSKVVVGAVMKSKWSSARSSVVAGAVVLGFWALGQAHSQSDVESRVDALLTKMTLEQKVAQMIQGEIKHVTPADVRQYGLGSVLNGGGSFPAQNKYASVQDWVNLADSYYLASVDTSEGSAGIPVI